VRRGSASTNQPLVGTCRWLFVVPGVCLCDGGCAAVGPGIAEVWPTNRRAKGMGAVCEFGRVGKIVGVLGLALTHDSANVDKPDVTVAAIPTCFLFLAARRVLCGLGVLVFGFETDERSLAALDEDDRATRPTPVAATVGVRN
jgi:MFS transporter, putative metabolite:H+ symporter